MGAAAARLGAKPGGTFGALVSTAAKYGWVSVRRGRVRTEGRYRDYRTAGDEAQRRATLLEAMRAAPLFRRLLDRFAGRSVPTDHLPKLLAREFDVPESAAARVAGYFLEAARAAGALEGDRLRGSVVTASNAPMAERRPRDPRGGESAARAAYTVRVSGPDVETTIALTDVDDLDLLRAVVAKVERSLRARRGAPRD